MTMATISFLDIWPLQSSLEIVTKADHQMTPNCTNEGRLFQFKLQKQEFSVPRL